MDRHNDMRATLQEMRFPEYRPSFYPLNVGETHYTYALRITESFSAKAVCSDTAPSCTRKCPKSRSSRASCDERFHDADDRLYRAGRRFAFVGSFLTLLAGTLLGLASVLLWLFRMVTRVVAGKRGYKATPRSGN
jgi:hypothetical protein